LTQTFNPSLKNISKKDLGYKVIQEKLPELKKAKMKSSYYLNEAPKSFDDSYLHGLI